jgi:signal transduction histidine kinase/CheY-like chemotaxis protein
VRQFSTLVEFRATVFRLALFAVSLGIWIIVIVDDVLLRLFQGNVLILWLLVQGVCGLSFAVSTWKLGTATRLFVLGMNVITIGYAFYAEKTLLLAVLAIFVMLSVLLNGLTFTLFLTITITGFSILAFSSSAVYLPLFITWAMLLMSIIVFRGLYHVLNTNEQYQVYALQQLEETRQHRAALMKLTKALNEAKEDLERANVQLNHLHYVAEEARNLKAQFAANVSHELRTPINLIVGFTDMLIHRVETEHHSSLHWSTLHTISRNAKHLQGLINDVLDMSQIDAGQMAVLREETSPSKVLSEAAELVTDAIRNKGLTFTVSVPHDLPLCYLDRLRVRQVVLNLLGNALRFTDQGGITLTAQVHNQSLLVSVADTGIGIPPTDKDRVFDEFHQLENARSRRSGGSGLGLALSKQFVEMQGGRLWVESEGIPGRGSTFYFTVPLRHYNHPVNVTSLGKNRMLVNPPGGRYFVVLDDDATVTRLFERYTARHRAIAASTLDEAVNLLAHIHPTALVMNTDTNPSGTSTVHNRLAQLGLSIPIIECPMPSSKRSIQHSFPILDYLTKPVSFEDMENAIARLTRPVQDILIVDDDREIVALFSSMLSRISLTYRIRRAYSVTEAVAFMRRQPPDLLILDMLIQDLTGLDVLNFMKTTPAMANTSVIMASAWGALETVANPVQGVIKVYKQNGFQPIELVRCIEALVERLNFTNAVTT